MERRQPDLILIVARSFAAKLATPTLIADAEGNLVYFNEAAASVLGRPYVETDELPATQWAELFSTEGPDAEPLPLEKLPAGIALLERRPAHGHFSIVGLDGNPREISVTAFPLLSHPEELVGVVAIFWQTPASA